MKKIYLLIIPIFFTINLNAQWTRTNVDSMNTGLEAMCEHNGSLYASIFGKGLIKYNETLSQWQEVADNLPPTGNSAHITTLASSGNYLYAYVKNQSCASTTIYVSTDNGITFKTDTAGHPTISHNFGGCKGYPIGVQDTFVLNGQIINVINGGSYTKKPTDTEWVKVNPYIQFIENYGIYKNTWYITGSTKLLTSTDSGATWLTPANSGFSSGFVINTMNVNPSSGRIYVTNEASQFNTVPKLFYSDNEGASWDSLPINQYLGTDQYGFPQAIESITSNGIDITLFLINDARNTRSDVFNSSDGGQTFAKDTVGLPNDQWGTIAVVKFLYFKSKLWMALNSPDIFIQGASTMAINEISKLNSKLYPNPCSNFINIENDYPISSIKVSNMLGQVIVIETPLDKSHTIDLSKMPDGMYYISITANNLTETVKLLKR